MSKIRNALKSVRVKLFMTLSLVILLIILFLIIVNNFVFGQFYIYSKTKSLISVYDLVNDYYNGEVEGDITSQLEKMAIQNNFDILIKNDQNVNVYTSNKDFFSTFSQMSEMTNDFDSNFGEVIERNKASKGKRSLNMASNGNYPPRQRPSHSAGNRSSSIFSRPK